VGNEVLTKPSTPQEFIAELGALSETIQASIPWNEENGRVSPEIVALLQERGFFNLLSAKEFGGSDLSPFESLAVFEEFFSIDAVTAWITMIPNVHNKQLQLLPFENAAAICADGVPVLAGQAAPTGTAERVEGGYIVTGHWEYGSGIQNADLVLGGAMITENGVRSLNADGAPQAIMVFMPAAEVQLAGNWDVLGLRASGSFDYEVKDLFVPDAMVVIGNTVPVMKWGGKSALLGMTGWLVHSHSVIDLGLGKRLIDEISVFASTPNRRGRLADSELFRRRYAEAVSAYRSARSWMYSIWEDIERTLDAGEEPTTQQHTDARAALLLLSRANKTNADWIFEEAGGKSLRAGVINRWFRDIKAAGQHNQVSRKFYNDVARDYLGEADGMVWSPNALVKKVVTA